jgi:hypothetical protein
MTGAVWLHVLSYLFICFAYPYSRLAINWPEAARIARKRLAKPAADTDADDTVVPIDQSAAGEDHGDALEEHMRCSQLTRGASSSINASIAS